jgi:hypothetical protein
MGRQLDTAPGIAPNPRNGIKIKTCQGPTRPEPLIRPTDTGLFGLSRSKNRVQGWRIRRASKRGGAYVDLQR